MFLHRKFRLLLAITPAHPLSAIKLDSKGSNGCHSLYVLIVNELNKCDYDNNIRIIL